MKKKLIAVGTIAILLGLVVAGFGGYRMGFDAGVAQDEGSAQEDRSTESSHPPHDVRIVEIEEHTRSMDDAFRSNIIPSISAEDFNLMEIISFLQCRSVENDPQSGGIHIAIGHPLVHSPDFNDARFTLKTTNISVLEVLDAVSEQTGITYSIRPCAVLWGKQKPEAEQVETPDAE